MELSILGRRRTPAPGTRCGGSSLLASVWRTSATGRCAATACRSRRSAALGAPHAGARYSRTAVCRKSCGGWAGPKSWPPPAPSTRCTRSGRAGWWLPDEPDARRVRGRGPPRSLRGPASVPSPRALPGSNRPTSTCVTSRRTRPARRAGRSRRTRTRRALSRFTCCRRRPVVCQAMRSTSGGQFATPLRPLTHHDLPVLVPGDGDNRRGRHREKERDRHPSWLYASDGDDPCGWPIRQNAREGAPACLRGGRQRQAAAVNWPGD